MPDTTSAEPDFPGSSSPSNDASNDPTINSTTTINGNYDNDGVQQKLVMWQGIALLTADCMGVGILGLPSDMKVLGWAVGLSFLVLNCPINYFAGNLLSILASDIERKEENATIDDDGTNTTEIELAATINPSKKPSSIVGGDIDAFTIRRKFSNKKKSYRGLPQNQPEETISQAADDCNYNEEYDVVICNNGDENDSQNGDGDNDFPEGAFQDEIVRDEDAIREIGDDNNHRETSDLINITAAIFSPIDSLTSRTCIMLVKIIYYANLFLVLGDYILVMSRSVAALFGEENICLPTAGAVASILMFGLCQFRTMANLGRSVSLASLFALLIVLVQCLFHHHQNTTGNSTDIPQSRNLKEEDDIDNNNDGIWGKFSSLAGIGFAVGSQKLFLNIRHELQHRDESSRVLAGSLFTYGMAYVAVVLLSGPDPPSFLFDSIPEGWGRKIAGLLLWFHVAVSYAINSQALCASLDQMLPIAKRPISTASWCIRSNPAVTRWFGITLMVSLSSYIVSNAIPFFKDLVALIGALTSVPLSLTLPAILHRKARSIALLLPDRFCLSTDSYLLLLYSFVFLIIGLIGAMSEIEEDWLSQGRPFACR
jgi:amino acid permease